MTPNKNVKFLYTEMIKNLPEADIPFPGLKGWILQGEDHQIVFFDIEPIGKVSEHAHGAQWGMVIEGEIELTVGGVTNTYKDGDCYAIPHQVVHSAVFKKRSRIMDFFADKDRYKIKDR
ncbi:MAG: cupin domain-containing protein [Bacteroidales bacterium]|nr:cupin domain-containing protein [Bacteroidales bacterium]